MNMQEQHGFPPARFRFVWKGKVLLLHEKLSDLEIVHESVLHIITDDGRHPQVRESAGAPTVNLATETGTTTTNPIGTGGLSVPAVAQSIPNEKCCVVC
jgi:hypothetical protein